MAHEPLAQAEGQGRAQGVRERGARVEARARGSVRTDRLSVRALLSVRGGLDRGRPLGNVAGARGSSASTSPARRARESRCASGARWVPSHRRPCRWSSRRPCWGHCSAIRRSMPSTSERPMASAAMRFGAPIRGSRARSWGPRCSGGGRPRRAVGLRDQRIPRARVRPIVRRGRGTARTVARVREPRGGGADPGRDGGGPTATRRAARGQGGRRREVGSPERSVVA